MTTAEGVAQCQTLKTPDLEPNGVQYIKECKWIELHLANADELKNDLTGHSNVLGD